MTLSSQITKVQYKGDNSSQDFTVPFLFLEEEHLSVVIFNDNTLVETVQVLNTDYTVTGANDPNGGTVTLVIPPESFEKVTVIRDTPYSQLIDLAENNAFPANTVEFALDKLTMLLQQADELIRRGVLLKVTSADDPSFSAGGLSDVFIAEVTTTADVNGLFTIVEQQPLVAGGWQAKTGGISEQAAVLPNCITGWEADIPVIVVAYAYVDSDDVVTYHFEAPQVCA